MSGPSAPRDDGGGADRTRHAGEQAGSCSETAENPGALAHRACSGVWSFLVRWFRVPEQPPTLPTAPGEQAVSFRPSPEYLRYLKVLFWIALLVIDILLTMLWIGATIALIAMGLWYLALILAPIALAIIIVPDIIAYVAIHLRYDTTWYVMTSRSLRVRSGIWIIREQTLTFENVQNVRLVQGPLQRHFGIATVLVETAGGGGSGQKGQAQAIGHHASIEGVTNAEEIRNQIMARVRQSRHAGLGDERDAAVAGTASAGVGRGITAGALGARHLALLRSIRDELRAAASLGPRPRPE